MEFATRVPKNSQPTLPLCDSLLPSFSSSLIRKFKKKREGTTDFKTVVPIAKSFVQVFVAWFLHGER